jgi:Co/Zn/Cd efflux system component
MKAFIGGTLIVVGLMVMAGSAGDCDGKCMDQANSLGEMLMVAAAGLFATVVGFLVAKNEISG